MTLCDPCNFAYDDHFGSQLVHDLHALTPEFEAILGAFPREPEVLTTRPDAQTWSALEYACHVRDVFFAQRERLFLALIQDTPSFVQIYREARVELDHYNEQDPNRVANQLATIIAMLGDLFSALSEDQWHRTCVYNFPTPTERDLVWFAAHTLHEGVHHLGDIRRIIADITSPDLSGDGTSRHPL